jgi:hypothetical protein
MILFARCPRKILWAAVVLSFASAVQAADDGENHWTQRDVLSVLRWPSATEPVSNPIASGFPGDAPMVGQAAEGQLFLRDYGGWDPIGGLRLEWNVLADLQASSTGLGPTDEPAGRSALGERRFQAESGAYADIVADQLNVRWQGDVLNAVLGRQCVNFGQNYYFSPLDLFLPFQPEDPYRDFRQGVDALRLTVATGRYSFVEGVACAGYAPKTEGSNPSQDPFEMEGPTGRGAALARAQMGGESWALTALCGRYATDEVAGVSAQWECVGSSWTGEILAGQCLASLTDTATDREAATLGWTRQWSKIAGSHAEFFVQNGEGFLGAENATASKSAALNAQFQVRPFLGLIPAILWYGDDGQAVLALDSALSTGEAGTLHFIVNLPILIYGSGDPEVYSRTQNQPGVVSLDYRLDY